MDHESRLREIVAIGYKRLCGKISGGRISIDNEASLQLQFASILKSLGELYEETLSERFSIELEKTVMLKQGSFEKSKSNRAKIDIWLNIKCTTSGLQHSCAIELKFFKKVNHREPNNRYDVFKDLQNLEQYGAFVDYGVLLVATDHQHYVTQQDYSSGTAAFDFRHGAKYQAGEVLVYATAKPYGPPITLFGNYQFNWDRVQDEINFLLLEVNPQP